MIRGKSRQQLMRLSGKNFHDTSNEEQELADEAIAAITKVLKLTAPGAAVSVPAIRKAMTTAWLNNSLPNVFIRLDSSDLLLHVLSIRKNTCFFLAFFLPANFLNNFLNKTELIPKWHLFCWIQRSGINEK
jgi:hypothetical protein